MMSLAERWDWVGVDQELPPPRCPVWVNGHHTERVVLAVVEYDGSPLRGGRPRFVGIEDGGTVDATYWAEPRPPESVPIVLRRRKP